MTTPTTSVVRAFWLNTCGYDTHRLGSNYAQHETPWNRFSANGILVATLWQDEIVTVNDGGTLRRFISLGGKMGAWKGPAQKHGKDAEDNLNRALHGRLRVVGYEAEPLDAGGARRVRFFYMDRSHELVPVYARDTLIDRLGLRAQLEAACPELTTARRPGTVFELLPLNGPPPSPHGPAPASGPVHEADDQDDKPATVAGFADLALPFLVAHVRSQCDGVMPTMTYGNLAESIGWFDRNGKPHARAMGPVLKQVLARIDAAALDPAPPLLTAVVVAGSGPNEGLPEAGVESRWPGYVELSKEEKRARVLVEYDRLLAYGPHWDMLLARLGVPIELRTASPGWGGGESPAHRALKEYVLANPHEFEVEVGAGGSVEYALKSGDSIDVFFSSARQWMGIEVKSCVSDGNPVDYERGIFQVIKYRAVLGAQAAAEHPRHPPEIRVLLVLQGRLPAQYRQLAKKFGIDVRELVGPTAKLA